VVGNAIAYINDKNYHLCLISHPLAVMKPNHSVQYSLLLVIFAHAAALATILYAPQEPAPTKIEPPTIQGVLVASEPEKKVEPPAEQKPQPKPKAPLPKAPPSERAVHQEESPPPVPVTEQRRPAEPSPAPVTLPSAEANGLNNPAPVYPSASRKLKEEGVVLLEILVKADGSIGEMRLKKSSGYSRLDDSAMRAVKNWHFSPATRDGEAIDYWYELPIEFSLNH
jgi:protein TonB